MQIPRKILRKRWSEEENTLWKQYHTAPTSVIRKVQLPVKQNWLVWQNII